MGVKYIQYKIAECDICLTRKEFNPVYSIPDKWVKLNITSTVGDSFEYSCICPECAEKIRDSIEEMIRSHKKEYIILREDDDD